MSVILLRVVSPLRTSTVPVSPGGVRSFQSLQQMDFEAMKELTTSMGHKAFRAKQLHEYVRKKGITDAMSMKTLPMSLRVSLAERVRPTTLSLDAPGGSLLSSDGEEGCFLQFIAESALTRLRAGRQSLALKTR